MPVLLLATEEGLNLFSFVEAIDTVQAIILILGLVLMIVEIFVPGFGIAGGAGLVLLIVGIILTARSTFEALMMILILIIIVAAVLAILLRSANRGRLSRTVVLQSAARGEEGYRSTIDQKKLMGLEGTTLTVLRPSGTAEIGGERYDVVAEGSYIPAHVPIKVIRVEGRRIVVRPEQDHKQDAKEQTT